MKLSLAPMEGITTHVLRRAIHQVYGGVDLFFTPFIAAARMNAREKRDLLPEHNPGMRVIPQMLTDSPADFLSLARELSDLGFTEINLNLGCPSRTVVRGGRGAGFLARRADLESFLDRVFSISPLKISAKTRIGYFSPEEWEELLSIYRSYPFTAMTVHPRTGVMMYSGQAEPLYVKRAAEVLPCPVIYNGDICMPEDLIRIRKLFTRDPETRIRGYMLGRGLISDPRLAARIKALSAGKTEGSILTDPAFSLYHQFLLEGYGEEGLPRKKHLDKMKELWTYFLARSPLSPDLRKRLFSSQNFPEYETAVQEILHRCSEEYHNEKNSSD